MKLYEELINSDELSIFYEWHKIATAKFVASNNVLLFAKMRGNIASLSPLSDEKIRATRFDMLAVPK